MRQKSSFGQPCDLGRTGSAAMTDSIAAALIDSDRLYFGLNGRTRRLGPFQLTWTEGFSSLPAGGVAHQIEPLQNSLPAKDLEAHLDAVERVFESWTNPLVRLYALDCSPVRDTLYRRGYDNREEVGFARTEPADPANQVIELVPVENEAGWQEKLALQRGDNQVVDGHACKPEEWVSLECTRSRTGKLRFYLVRSDNETHGTFGLMKVGSVLRVKNLYLRPGSRGRGIGTAALKKVFQQIDGDGIQAVVLLALRGAATERFYEKLGMKEVCRLNEWSRALE